MSAIPSGIYCIRHDDGRVYVGSARNLQKRLAQHRAMLAEKKHHSIKLQNAWSKYGAEAFTFNVLEHLSDLTMLVLREQFWIDHFNAYGQRTGFNVCPKAGSVLGLKHTIESRLKMRNAQTGKKHGPRSIEARQKMRMAQLGKKHSAQTIAKISASKKGAIHGPPSQTTREKIRNTLLGQKFTEQRRANISAGQKGKKQDPASAAIRQAKSVAARLRNKMERLAAIQPCEQDIRPTIAKEVAKPISKKRSAPLPASRIGRKHSAETISKLTGRKFTPEHCAKISAARTGMKFTPQHCANLSNQRRGKTLTAAHKAKLSVAGKGVKQTPEVIAARTGKKRGPYQIPTGRILIGHPQSEETRLKISAAHAGKKKSAETIANMIAAKRRLTDLKRAMP